MTPKEINARILAGVTGVPPIAGTPETDADPRNPAMNELENQERLDRSAAEARGMTLPEYYRDLARRVASKDARISLERTRIAASDPGLGYPIVEAEDFPEDYE
jgi:hypothetical protein